MRRGRLQAAVHNNTDIVDFNVDITIPPSYQAKDTATLQVGGSEHHQGCLWDCYKVELGINKPGIKFWLEKGDGPPYVLYTNGVTIFKPNYMIKSGQRVQLRVTNENINNNSAVRITVYDGTTPLAQLIDTGQNQNGAPYIRRRGVTSDCNPVDQLRIDNWPNDLDPGSYLHSYH